MIKRSELRTADAVHGDRYVHDPEYAREYDRTRLANEVAVAVLRYRADNSLSQTDLAERLGMSDSDIAALEDGEEPPSVELLERLVAAHVLAVEIRAEDGAHVHPWAV